MSVSWLSKATSGLKETTYINLLYGVPGSGKSTLAAQWEKAIYFDLEDGTKDINVFHRIEKKHVPTIDVLMSMIKDLINETHDFKSLVIDSLEKVESMMIDRFVKKSGKSVDDMRFAVHQKQTKLDMSEMMELLQALCTEKQMTIILVGHSHLRQVNNPTLSQPYDTHTLRINDHMSAVAVDLSDNVFFLDNVIDSVKKEGKLKKAFGDGRTKKLSTLWSPNFTAKRRYMLDDYIEYTLEEVASIPARLKRQSADDIYAEVVNLAVQVRDDATREKATASIEAAKGDPTKLAVIKRRLLELV